jgi:hypothetical protein
VITIVEVPTFVREAAQIWSSGELDEIKDFLARNPGSGDVIPGAGGVRKLRWAVEGRGKRGGARVIYYYHSRRLPLFLLTAFRKNRTGDLTMAQKHNIGKLVKGLLAEFRS